MIKRFSILFSTLLLCSSLPAKPLQKRIEKIVENSPYARKTIGILVKDVTNGYVLAAYNHDNLFIPASIMKLITGAAAFELLGHRYRYETGVFFNKENFSKDSGVVKDNLYIRGNGDPGFYAERLWLFVQNLTHNGVTSINGDIVLDDFCFDNEINGPGFNEDNSSLAYEAPIAALSANFNTVAVHISPGSNVDDPVVIKPFPRIKGVKIISTAKTTAPDTKSKLEVKTELMDGRTAILVFGNMRIDEKPKYKYRKVWSTWENFGWMLQALFESNGITFSGSIRHEPVPPAILSQGPLFTFQSRPLPEYVFNMFKYSSNFAAEMIFKTIASEHDTLPGSWKTAAGLVNKWWKRQQVSTPGAAKNNLYPVIVNGSGMGDQNRVSPGHIAALLEYVLQQKTYAPEFMHALSVAGVDGTLRDRFKKSPLQKILRGKTGTLNNKGVSNLAGYILLPKKIYIFVIFINNKKFSQITHWNMQKKLLEAVIRPCLKRESSEMK